MEDIYQVNGVCLVSRQQMQDGLRYTIGKKSCGIDRQKIKAEKERGGETCSPCNISRPFNELAVSIPSTTEPTQGRSTYRHSPRDTLVDNGQSQRTLIMVV